LSFEENKKNTLRHPAELILFIVSAFVSTAITAILIFGLYLLLNGALVVQSFRTFYVGIIAVLIALFTGMGRTFAATRLNSVRIGPNQFPDLYKKACDISKRLGMKRVPEIYIKQNNGMINAFAAYFWGRNYVLLNTEILETAYLEHKDEEAVSFVLAHEIAHIYLNHTKLWYNIAILFSKLIPFLGTALSRAQEFSCDRIAAHICPEGKHGIFIIVLGRHLYKSVDIETYLHQAENTDGLFEFIVNLSSTHPVNARRILALYGKSRGKLF